MHLDLKFYYIDFIKNFIKYTFVKQKKIHWRFV